MLNDFRKKPPCRIRSSWLIEVGVLGLMGAIVLLPQPTLAQLETDTTLGTEQTRVVPLNGLNDRIDGGATRGINLFHSFREFNVGEGRGVYFANPDGIVNILSRVTGSNPSNIFGRLGVLGNANLFLLNPNGIVFGENASLDIPGSFVATTANAIQFGTDGLFSASAPEVPSPLLTINPSAFFFNQVPTGGIVVNSGELGSLGLSVGFRQNLTLLGGNVSIDGGQLYAFGGRVDVGAVAGTGSVALNPDGSLNFPDALVRGDVLFTNSSFVGVAFDQGGDIAVTGRTINVLGGSILQAGIFSGYGFVGSRAGDLLLNATEEIRVGQSSIIQNSVFLDAVGDSGDIRIMAGSLTLLDTGRLSTSTSGQGDAGGVFIDADGAVSLSGSGTVIFNNIEHFGNGNAGGISITADSLSLTSGAQLQSAIRGAFGDLEAGRGAAGDISINVRGAVTLAEVGVDGRISGIYANVGSEAVGTGGDILITTGSLTLQDGALMDTSTFGQGDIGSVIINASGAVSLSGSGTVIFNNIENFGNGNAGGISITADTLSLINGAQLQSGIRGTSGTLEAGRGTSGGIYIDVRGAVTLAGVAADGRTSGIYSDVGFGAVGTGGDILITTGSLTLQDGALLNSSTAGQGDIGSVIINASGAVSLSGSGTVIFNNIENFGNGNAGGISITADTLSLTNSAQLQSAIRGASDNLEAGRGVAGDINIDVRGAVTLAGVGDDGRSSSIYANLGANAIGTGGNISITAGSLTLQNGAQLVANTFGQGNAGNIIIGAGTVTFDSISNNGLNTGAFSTVEQSGVGNGGNVRVTADTLFLTNGAQLNASTFGRGNAGDVIVDVGSATFDGRSSSGFSSAAGSIVGIGAIGRGGNVRVTADTLSLTNGAQLSASTLGQGDAGDVIISVGNAAFDGVGSNGVPSGAFSTVELQGIGRGGSVRVTADTLSLTNGAVLNASTFAQGDAGDVNVDAGSVNIDGVGSNGFSSAAGSIVGIGAIGRGGNVRIAADTLSLTNGGALLVNSLGQGDAGSIAVIADFIRLDQGSIQAQTAAGNGGNIALDAENLIVLRNGGFISATAGNAQAGGNGGNVTIDAPFIVAIPKENSDITANAFTGSGGNITITAQGIFGLQFRPAVTPLSDITASSELGVTGVVSINSPDTSSLQNSLTEFSQTLVDPNQLLSTSCIVRRDSQGGSFFITGTSGLPVRPGDAGLSAYPTGTVRSPSGEDAEKPPRRSWKPGDPIVEPQGVYQLPDGRLVLSRECP